MSGYDVRLSRAASAALGELPRQHRGRLTMELHGLARAEPPPSLLTLSTPTHTAACDVLADLRVLLVYAVLANLELRTRLLGPELDELVRGRGWRRVLHGHA